jgi:hypothetical protein
VVVALHEAARPAAERGDTVRRSGRGIVEFVVGHDVWIAVAVLVQLAAACAHGVGRGMHGDSRDERE